MYIVKNSKGETTGFYSREEDALAMVNLDLGENNRPYTIEKMIGTPGEAIHKGQLCWEPIEYHPLSYGNDELEVDISCYVEEK